MFGIYLLFYQYRSKKIVAREMIIITISLLVSLEKRSPFLQKKLQVKTQSNKRS